MTAQLRILLQVCWKTVAKVYGLRKFIEVDNHEAVKVGGLRRGLKSFKVVKSKFRTDFPGAVFREGAGELTLRAHEEGVRRTFIDTSTVGHQRW